MMDKGGVLIEGSWWTEEKKIIWSATSANNRFRGRQIIRLKTESVIIYLLWVTV